MGNLSVGIELGSTRIKAVLIDGKGAVLAIGVSEWENRLENGYWTYSLEDVDRGIKQCAKRLTDSFPRGVSWTDVGKLGISAMMHGFLALDRDDNLLTPFRTWRNTNTARAADALTELFGYNIPLRWSAAHLYQAVLDGESYVKDIAYITTLSGYVHYRLTGEKVLGIGDASGMFPVSSKTLDYNEEYLNKFDELLCAKGVNFKARDILPKVMVAGQAAGALTRAGAEYLGIELPASKIVLCPPEGDAGTGMVATNSVSVGSGNVSAGTSVFLMAVIDGDLSELHREIDMVATPAGSTVAMVHGNNCTADIDAWVKLFKELLDCFGVQPTVDKLYSTLFQKALEGDDDVGKLIDYNYISAEPIAGVDGGAPMFLRSADSKFGLGNFIKAQIYGALASLAFGVEILQSEGVKINDIYGHGGLFKGGEAVMSSLSAITESKVTVLDNAGEGGAWGMALLANFIGNGADLGEYLNEIFVGQTGREYTADEREIASFKEYFKEYKSQLFRQRT